MHEIDLTAEESTSVASGDEAPKRASVGGRIERLNLPGGVLDPEILSTFDAIAQQSNCVGCDGRGLSEAVARTLPYGCPYRARRRQPSQRKFAVPEDRAAPGTIAVQRPTGTAVRSNIGSPVVVSIFGQWETGAAGKYNIVPVPPGCPQDSAANRETWFKTGLDAIGRLDPPLYSIAFPHEIGCCLGGGSWQRYEAMLTDFAAASPGIRVAIVKLSGHVD